MTLRILVPSSVQTKTRSNAGAGFRLRLRFCLVLAPVLALSTPWSKSCADIKYDGANYVGTDRWIGYDVTTGKGALGSLTVNRENVVNGQSELTTNALRVGYVLGGEASVILDGEGSKITVKGAFFVGWDGTGTLEIRNGGDLFTNATSGFARIGSTADGFSADGSLVARSRVIVDGQNSMWECLYLGIGVGNAASNKVGDLEIRNGGYVKANGMVVEKGSSLLVTGAKLELTSTLRIESSITNAAVVSAGGILDVKNVSTIGTTFNADKRDGTLTVTGAGSQANFLGLLTVGSSSGRGTLTIADGGLVSVSALTSPLGTGDGEILLGGQASSSNPGTPKSEGTLYVGTGGAAGKLNVATIYGHVEQAPYLHVAPVSTLIFNHNESAYQFTNTAGNGIVIGGSTKVQILGGTTTFTAASTYQGGTQITGGTLRVNNTTGSGTGTGAVTVSGTGTLGGSGSVTGNITVESGGATHPGNSKVFSGSNLEYKTGSTAKFTLGAPVSLAESPVAGQDYDQIALTGNLKVGTGTTLELQLTASTMAYFHDHNGTDPLGNYFLFDLTAPITGKFDFLSLMLDGTTYTQAISGGRATFTEFDLAFDVGYTGNAGTNSLTGGSSMTVHAVASVPEPMTGLLLVFGAGALVMRRRR